MIYIVKDFRCSCHIKTHMAWHGSMLFYANHSTINKHTVNLIYPVTSADKISYSIYQMSILNIKETRQYEAHESGSHLRQALFESLLKFSWMYVKIIT